MVSVPLGAPLLLMRDCLDPAEGSNALPLFIVPLFVMLTPAPVAAPFHTIAGFVIVFVKVPPALMTTESVPLIRSSVESVWPLRTVTLAANAEPVAANETAQTDAKRSARKILFDIILPPGRIKNF
jgi:hypothetical protein